MCEFVLCCCCSPLLLLLVRVYISRLFCSPLDLLLLLTPVAVACASLHNETVLLTPYHSRGSLIMARPTEDRHDEPAMTEAMTARSGKQVSKYFVLLKLHCNF